MVRVISEISLASRLFVEAYLLSSILKRKEIGYDKVIMQAGGIGFGKRKGQPERTSASRR